MLGEMVDFGKSDIDSEGKLRLLKGSRGMAVFCEQHIKNTNIRKDNEVLFANKVLTHKQAVGLRDFLIKNYPLGDLT